MKKLLILLFAIILIENVNAKKRLYTISKINTEPPIIDGIITETVWENVEWSGDFIQRSPYENKPPSQQTKFKILYDDNNLYIAIRCFDSAPDSIEKRMSRRDGFPGDWIEVNIDSYHDLRTAFSFTVSASGVKSDEAITNDDDWDSSWDPIWYVKTNLDDLGWIAEMKIPFSQLRFGKQKEYIWGLQVNRRIFRKDERSSWQFISPKSTGWVSHFGELHGIKNISPQKQMDIVPYTVARYESYRREDQNPYADGNDIFGKIGVDGKIGITNDLTLDFAINPDFGQVEADPSEVNLSTYETYFREKRPFFIEGKNILSFGLTGGNGPLSNDNLFYSRRIGNKPSYSPDLEDDEYAKRIESTTILGAFKLTGKTRKGWSIGIMESLTEREKIEIYNDGEKRMEEVEPFTNYFAGRIQRDMNNSNTRIGAMFTAVNRDLSSHVLNNCMHRAAYSGGIDFNHQWKDKTYYINFSTAVSHIRGSRTAIYETQTSSPHYFQRPNTNYLKVDSTKTYLNGLASNLQFGRAGNGKIRYMAWITFRSPGFNINDIGYMRRNDEIQQITWIGFNQNEPIGIFRNFNIGVNQWLGLTFKPEKRYFGGNIYTNFQFKNYWNFGTGVSREGKSFSSTTLRGGPHLVYDGNTNIWTYLSTDNRKKIRFSFNYWFNVRDYNTSFSDGYSFGTNIQLSDACRLSIQPGYRKRRDEIAYVETLDDLDDIRYIRGKINLEETSLTLRLNYNISPDFTIQYYCMPFICAGKYSNFKYIHNPMANDYDERYMSYSETQIVNDIINEEYNIDEDVDGITDYSFENPNFNVFDFNSNLVIRWEYKPNSTLFVVWSQIRNDFKSNGNFNIVNDVKELFNSYPHDIFLLKISYRFGL